MNQKHIKYIELLTNEYLKRSDSFDPQTIRRQMNEGSISVHVSEALAAMAELQKEIDRLKAENDKLYKGYKFKI